MMQSKTLSATAMITLVCFTIGYAVPARAEPPVPQQTTEAMPPPQAAEGQPAAPPQQPPPTYYYPQAGYPPQAYPQAMPQPYYRPQSIRYEMRPRIGLAVAGGSVFGGMYLMTVLFTSSFDNLCSGGSSTRCNLHWPMYIPIIGPFIDIPNIINHTAPGLVPLVVFDGLTQAAGVAMLIAGLVTRKRVPVYPEQVSILPMTTPSGGGIMALGRF